MVLRGAVEPIPQDLDAHLIDIRIGQRLGVPALAAAGLSPYWRTVAAIDLEVEAIAHQRQMEKARQRQKPPTRGRRR